MALEILCFFFVSVEVILRAEAVEQAQAGDKCDFTGTLIVVPDVSKLSLPGRSNLLNSIRYNRHNLLLPFRLVRTFLDLSYSVIPIIYLVVFEKIMM